MKAISAVILVLVSLLGGFAFGDWLLKRGHFHKPQEQQAHWIVDPETNHGEWRCE